ncbi:hypothetical protein GPECTOR_189g293 [Gonium pectorale]|uniref:Apple domain-containing protein n=1 Tax=Gonium pectorale TaxID=33097 RepID=A0A150FX43_GONPE|nr:hypothetical protein GPECTOR_189g293 [Gonium pectorale]|eukprot:KXZ42181.1 hypothetical protein GPECTOR_189g293 [Gonium pectorale]
MRVSRGVDIGGYDLSSTQITTVQDGAAKCLSDPTCQTFNWNRVAGSGGYLKSVTYSANLVSASPNVCLYTKPACPAAAGFTVYGGIDITGSSLSATSITSVQDGATKCAANPSCVSFNWVVGASPAVGYIKSVAYTSNAAKASTNTCFYAKQAQAILERMDAAMCGTIAEQYGYRPAVTWGSTPQAIQTLAGANNCDAKVCAYMNQRYGVQPGVTYGRLPADWYSSYANANCHNIILGCPSVPGYLSTPAVDHNFDDIANAGSAAAAATACNGNSNCWGYNAAGWTKTSGVPTSEVAGACFRTKLSSTLLDANACGALAEQYGLRPAVTWGSAPTSVQQQWVANNCDPKLCFYMVGRYQVVPGGSFGFLPSDWKASWNASNCNTVASAKAQQ